MPVDVFVRTGMASAVTAVAGSLGTRVGSRWYRHLRKPAWQPPGQVFGPVWTALYGAIAVGSGRYLRRCDDAAARRRFARALGVNLALNAGWSWVFFAARRPRLAVLESGLLAISTLDLVRRAGRTDRAAAVTLAPYAGWVLFATALTASIAKRNSSAHTFRHI